MVVVAQNRDVPSQWLDEKPTPDISFQNSPEVYYDEPEPVFDDMPEVQEETFEPVRQENGEALAQQKLLNNQKDVARETASEWRRRQSIKRMSQIYRLISDPKSDLAEINRLIGLEITLVIQEMNEVNPINGGIRALVERVKALRELNRNMSEREMLNRRDDLNMSGPKFRYVFGKMMGYFSRAVLNAGGDESFHENVMLHVGDEMRTDGENLKRGLARIEAGKEPE